jgi:hypothetical protein
VRSLLLLVVVGLLAALPAAAPAAACDDLDPSVCLYPWPNDRFTKPDPATGTGRRLDLQLDQMPRNAAGKPIDPTEINRNDGFSPGSLIVTRVPGLDSQAAFDRTGLVPITDPERSFDRDQPAVLIDATTRERQLIWAELEYPDELGKDASVQTLVLHPAKNLEEGHRYIVALRRLRRADGSIISAPAAFRAYRDGTPADARADHMESLFRTLRRAKIRRDDLYLAWDFTVASERNLSQRMLSIRDRAFAELGDTNLADLRVQGASPRFVVNPDLPDDLPSQIPGDAREQDGIVDFAPCSAGDPSKCEAGESDRLVRIVRGRVLVPCFLDTPECAEGGTFVYESDGVPRRIPGNTAAAPFTCIIPRAVLTRGPARPALYGHGLLGDGSQVTGDAAQDLASEHDILSCGTDWSGMSTEDIPNVALLLADLSRFASLADRGQQGMLNFLFLGRTLIHTAGFASDPAFTVDGTPAIDTSRLYYTGGSQGGIMGGSLTAVAPDFTRAALGVPAMNYSILLQRSIDFDTYAQVMYRAYPNELERPLILSLVQLLWDRAEANGYAHHMTRDPYPNTPPHEVILNMAWGDHQVTNWATLVEARTIGARLRTPALEPFRSYGGGELHGIPRIKSFPATGSLLGVWDVGPLRTVGGEVKGTPRPPTGNVPNREGVDPHGPDASEQASARRQVSAFLRPDAQSRIVEVCGADPCHLDGWDGAPWPVQ